MSGILRSVLSVATGLAGTLVAVIALTWVVVQVMLRGDYTAEPTGPFLAVNLVYSFGAAVFGGWLAARLAAHRPLRHGAYLAVVLLLLSLGGDSNPPEGGTPGWYYPVIGAVGAAGALLGGWIRSRSLPADRRGP